MEVWSRTFRYTFSFVLKSFIRTKWEFSPVMNIFFLLLVAKLWSFRINEIKNLIPPLFHHCYLGEIWISHDYIRCLEIEINSWLKTSWLKCNIWEDSWGKSLWVEIFYLTVVEFEPRVNITSSFIRILVKINIQLTKLSHITPSIFVN